MNDKRRRQKDAISKDTIVSVLAGLAIFSSFFAGSKKSNLQKITTFIFLRKVKDNS